MIIDTVRREAVAWTAMDRWPRFIDALMERLQAMTNTGNGHMGLTSLLLDLAEKGRLSMDDEEDVRLLAAGSRKVGSGFVDCADCKESIRSTAGWVGAAESMGDLRKATASGDPRALSLVSAKLFTRHGPFASWSALWFGTVMLGIQESEATPHSVLTAAITHVVEVVNRSNETLDRTISSWLSELDSTRYDLLAQPKSSTICSFILSLVALRHVQLVGLFEGLIYPVWKRSASAVIASKGRIAISVSRAIGSAVTLAQQSLLPSPPHKHLSPVNQSEYLIVETARAKVFDRINIQILIRYLPFLVVLENNKGMPEKIRSQISALLRCLASSSAFKAAVFRNPDLLKSVFLSNEWSKSSLDPSVETGMVDTLKLIMSDSPLGESICELFGLTFRLEIFDRHA